MTELHHGPLRIFGEVEDWFHRREHHERYHATETPPAPEAPVSVLDTIREEFGRAVAWTEDEFRNALPTVAKAADAAEALASSNAAQAVLSAVLGPQDEEWIIGLIQRLDQSAHTAEQAAAGAEVPADLEPLPGEPVPVPAGPVVGGTAR